MEIKVGKSKESDYDSEPQETTDNTQRLTDLVNQIDAGENLIAELEQKLKDAKQAQIMLLEDVAPAALRAMGIKGAKLDDGRTLEIVDKIGGSLKAADRAIGHSWLDKEGYGKTLIKREVVVAIGKDSITMRDLLMDKIGELMTKEGVKGSIGFDEKIETQTLGKFIREITKEADSISQRMTIEHDPKKKEAIRKELEHHTLPGVFNVRRWSEVEVKAAPKKR